jgi:hypothetical protein
VRSVTKSAGSAIAAILVQAGTVVAPPVASAQPVEFVPCSTSRLISAITTANPLGGRTLRLASHCTYLLTAVAEIGTGPNGLPIIRGNITLVGGPSTFITRAASAPVFRLIETAPGSVLRVVGIFLTGGSSTGTGGAIRNSGGTVVLDHTTLTRNRAQTLGGGIDNVNPGHVVINTSVISANTAATVNGGGMFNDGRASINFSRFTDNTSPVGDGGGLRTTGGNGLANIFRSTFDHNISGSNGGGISIGAPSSLTLIRSLIERNTANNAGGVFVAPGATLVQQLNVIRLNNPNNCVGTGC